MLRLELVSIWGIVVWSINGQKKHMVPLEPHALKFASGHLYQSPGLMWWHNKILHSQSKFKTKNLGSHSGTHFCDIWSAHICTVRTHIVQIEYPYSGFSQNHKVKGFICFSLVLTTQKQVWISLKYRRFYSFPCSLRSSYPK